MLDPGELRAPARRASRLAARPISWLASSRADVLAEVKTALATERFAVVSAFPVNKEILLDVLAALGEPMPKHSAANQVGADRYIGAVALAGVPMARALPTQTAAALPLHTARSYVTHRPRHFAMLCAQAGQTQDGLTGDGLFVHWDDVVAEHVERHGDRGRRDIELLSSTPVGYRPRYVSEPAADEPLLGQDATGGAVGRYWEHILKTWPEANVGGSPATRAETLAALRRFDTSVNDGARALRLPQVEGRLVILDNRKVAHGRTAFAETVIDAAGARVPNNRRIWSVHLA